MDTFHDLCEMVRAGKLTAGEAADILMLDRRPRRPWWWPAWKMAETILFGPRPRWPEW